MNFDKLYFRDNDSSCVRFYYYVAFFLSRLYEDLQTFTKVYTSLQKFIRPYEDLHVYTFLFNKYHFVSDRIIQYSDNLKKKLSVITIADTKSSESTMVSMASIQAEMNIDGVKTRTVEQLIAPLIQQVILLEFNF